MAKFLKERLGTIIFIVIVAAMVLWGTLSIKEAKNNAITFSDEYEAPEATANLLEEGEYKQVAKNSNLELWYNDTKGTIQIVNLENGYVWDSIYNSNKVGTKKLNAQWEAYCKSAITMSYNDLKKRDSGVKKLYAAKDCGFLSSEPLENGIAVTYGFLKPGIYVTVEYILDGDNLLVRIPWEKIREESRYAVSTIEVMPYLGACGNENEGYILYPDGSGAITTFEKVGERPSNIKAATYYCYTNKFVSMQNLMDTTKYDRYTAALPVYGIKNADNAVFAFGAKGFENSGIVVYPSGYVIDLNHASFEVYTRNVFNVNMSNISTESGSATGGMVQRVDKKVIEQDVEIRYAFLCGDKADYSGMADVYRSYLIENEKINKSVDTGNFSLGLSVLMGAEKEGIIYNEYIKMTDFEQLLNMVDTLKAAGVDGADVILDSWNSDWNDWEYWGPDSHLGGKSGLKKLSKYAEENSDVNFYLESYFSFGSDGTKKLDEDEDVAFDGINIEISWQNMDGMRTYLLNPQASYNRNADLLKKLNKYSDIGVAYADIGQYCYADYNTYHPFTKSETAAKLSSLLKNTKDNGRKVAVNGSNQYVYEHSDFIYGLKEDNFGLSITDHSVPFTEMIFSGLIPYCTDGAGNLAYDLQTQKLKWVEFGAQPFFKLTAESALNLRDTNRAVLFSSTFEDWLPVVTETYDEFKKNLSGVYGHQM
ncbi:MAG: DUF5696 domain-containing protein, partial [Lachnospiraceae bacterium]|nr:DUF5696 domain-containing protein [Lachnospiraceae bacterium]